MISEMTPTKFEQLTIEEQNDYVDNFKELFINQYMTREAVAEKLQVTLTFIKWLIKKYNIRKTKEQLKKTQENTCMKRYGVKSTNQLDWIKEKQANTCIKHYGVSSALKIPEKRNKLAIDNGYENVFQIPKIKEKIKQTNLEKYGVEYASQNLDIQKKVANTNLERYGNVCPMSSKENQEKIRKANLEKYGVEWCSQREDIKQSIKDKCMQEYNVPYYCMTENCRRVSGNNSQVNKRYEELFNKYGIEYEREFALENKSYDFKIGNILVEINPTFTHNSTKGIFSNKHYTPIDYHINKTKLALKYGYRCIHIWDWDEKYKLIYSIFNNDKQRIYARQCEVKQIKTKRELDLFLQRYHLQNSCNGQTIRYGLYYKDKLIQVMTFGKPRYNKNYQYELLRLCTDCNYYVIGGAERLFNHFIKDYNPINIISYCDNSKFSGDVYKRLGMTLESYGTPACNWSKGSKRITQNLLNKQGADRLIGTNDGKGTSNRDIMIREGWLEVYDCGQSVYTYKS